MFETAERLARLEAAQVEQQRLLAEIDKRLGGSDGATALVTRGDLAPKLKRIDQGIDAVVRALYLEPGELEFPERLVARRFRLRSQNQEDGITLALLREIGVVTRRFVDLGCGANGGNSGFLAAELGWEGLMVDASEERLAALKGQFPPSRVKVERAWITREGVNALLTRHGLRGEIDLLSIDIDGNDYWVWEAVSVCSPRVVIIEYNSAFGPGRSVVVPYEAEFERRRIPGMKGLYFGASLSALERLGHHLGYRLVAVEPRGTNAYFVRDEVGPVPPARDAGELFRPLNKHARLAAEGFDLVREIEKRGLPLVDLDRSHP